MLDFQSRCKQVKSCRISLYCQPKTRTALLFEATVDASLASLIFHWKISSLAFVFFSVAGTNQLDAQLKRCTFEQQTYLNMTALEQKLHFNAFNRITSSYQHYLPGVHMPGMLTSIILSIYQAALLQES